MKKPAIRLLTNSRLKARRRCPRYHLLKYDYGLEAIAKPEPLIFGDLIHRALEPWWLFWKMYDDSGDGALEEALQALDRVPDIDPFMRAKAHAMIEGYHRYYAPEMREGAWEVIDAEIEFVAPLVDPSTGERSRSWVLGGKLDVLAVYNPTKLRHLIEHKSSSEDLTVGADYWKRLRMDTQISHYYEGAAANGTPVDTCTYDVLRKPDQRRLKATPESERKYTQEKTRRCDCTGTGKKKAPPDPACAACGGVGEIVTEPPRLYANQRERDETPAEYLDRCRAAIAEEPASFYRREEIVRLEREVDQHRWDTWETAQTIEAAHRGRFSPRNPDACELYGRPCEYFPVCTGAESPENTALYQIRKSVHPELSFPEAPIFALGSTTEESPL